MFASRIVRFEIRYFEILADYDGKTSRKCSFTRNLQDYCMINPNGISAVGSVRKLGNLIFGAP